MERGELDSFGMTLWSSLTSTKPDWIRDKKIRILLQYGPEKEAALPDVPYGPDLVSNADDKLLFEAAYAPLSVGRPFVAPPDLPPERAAALRAAMLATFKDPEFLAEADKQRLEVDKPISGEFLAGADRSHLSNAGAYRRAAARNLLRIIEADGSIRCPGSDCRAPAPISEAGTLERIEGRIDRGVNDRFHAIDALIYR